MAPDQKPRIDIIVTAHNMEECLDECLQSLAAQTWRNFRAIVIEDASTDATLRQAQSFAAKDPRFSVVHTSFGKAAQARNHGLALVEAPHFMVVDGDDVFRPALLEKLHHAAADNNADIAVCDITQFDNATHEFTPAPWALKTSQLPTASAFSWRDVPGNVFAAFMGWPWDKLYRTSLIKAEGLTFPEDLANSEDMLFTYQALILATRIAVVDEVLIDHRIERDGSVSNSRVAEPLAFYEGICRLKRFLQERPDGTWNLLQRDFLNWALDWTLWNIETLSDQATQESLAQKLRDGHFTALELTEHDPAYFAAYPRNMARYASVLAEFANEHADIGPLGPLGALPYGKFKPWCQANLLEKIVIKRRMKRNDPVEW